MAVVMKTIRNMMINQAMKIALYGAFISLFCLKFHAACILPPKNLTCDCNAKTLICSDEKNQSDDVLLGAAGKSVQFSAVPLGSVNISVNSSNLSTDSLSCYSDVENLAFSSGLINISSDFLSCFNSTLTNVSLTRNNLSAVPSGSLTIIEKLEYLDLSYNDIRNVKQDDFFGLENLKVLNLGKNYIEHLVDETFYHLSQLEVLLLDFNKLVDMSVKSFDGLNKLKTLNLAANNLLKIFGETFQGLSSLHTLIINNNDFHSFSQIDIHSSTLTKLSCQNCSLKGSMTIEVFQNMPNLRILDLSFNNLDEVQSFAFSNLHKLEDLNISNNNLTFIRDDAFVHVDNLTYLNLENNEIVVIGEKAFRNLTKLKHLNLNNNKLTAVLETYILDLISLEKIELENNKLKVIRPKTFVHSPKLQTLKLKGNKLECSCDLHDFAGFLHNSTSLSQNDTESAECSSGEKLIEFDFISMDCISYFKSLTEDEDDDDYDYSLDIMNSTIQHTDTSVDTTAFSKSTYLPTVTSSTSISAENTSEYLSTILLASEPETSTTQITNNSVDTTTFSKSTYLLMSNVNGTPVSIETTSEYLPTTVIFDPLSNASASFTVNDTNITETEGSASSNTTDLLVTSTETQNQTVSTDTNDTNITETEGSASSNTADLLVTSTSTETQNQTLSTDTNDTNITETEGSASSNTADLLVTSTETQNQTLSTDTKDTVSNNITDDTNSHIDIQSYTYSDKKICFNLSINDLLINKNSVCLLFYRHLKGENFKKFPCPLKNRVYDSSCVKISAMELIDFCIKVKSRIPPRELASECYSVNEVITFTSDTIIHSHSESSLSALLNDSGVTETVENTSIPYDFAINLTTHTPYTHTNTPIIHLIPKKFNITNFNIFEKEMSLLVKWTVNKNEPHPVCYLILTLSSERVKFLNILFNCTSNAFTIKEFQHGMRYNICLESYHRTEGKINICRPYSYSVYEASAKQASHSPSVTFPIAVLIGLLIVIVCIIILISTRTLFCKHLNTDRYRVSEEEKKVQRRNNERQKGTSVRYSYTVNEREDLL